MPSPSQRRQDVQDALEDADVDAFSGSRSVLNENVPVGDGATEGDVLAELDSEGSPVVSISIDSPSAIDVRYDAGPDGQTYFEDVRTLDGSVDGDLTGVTLLRDTLQTGSRFIRVVLTDPADGTAEATISIEASG